jgi:polyphosphate kinase
MEAIYKGLLNDNAQAWELSSSGTWSRVEPQRSERRRPAQVVAMRRRMRAMGSSAAR